jgi:hypothetical protein
MEFAEVATAALTKMLCKQQLSIQQADSHSNSQ